MYHLTPIIPEKSAHILEIFGGIFSLSLDLKQDMGKRKVVATKDSSDNDDNLPRSAANARERTRMRVLSKSFERLKLTLPWVPADTKLSKLGIFYELVMYLGAN